MIGEKRKHKRFKTQEGVFSELTSTTTKLGQIKNISKGGINFHYVADEEQISGSHKINIFLNDDDFHLNEIPFKVISDYCVDYNSPFSTIIMMQCSGQFNELTQKQMFQLDYLIDHYTLGEV